MSEVGEDSTDEIPACGVPAEEDLGWGVSGQDVAEGGGCLAELGWVSGPRGESVG